MRVIAVVIAAVVVTAATVPVAHAAVFGAAVSSVLGFFGAGGFLAAGTVAGFVARAAIAFGVSYLAKALQPQVKTKGGGFKGTMNEGGIVPRAFIVGRWVTAGSLVYNNTYGNPDKTPNQFYVVVAAISDLPVSGLVEEWINGKQVTFDPDDPYDGGKGWTFPEFTKNGKECMFGRFHDGNQTSADTFLLDQFNDGSSRQWGTGRRGYGIAYGITTARFNPDVITQFPEVRWVVDGIPLYDPREDSTAGGSGSQRWNDQSTWTHSVNVAVIAYNVLRGIKYDDEWVWGGQSLTEASLPYSSWAAAMNACDETVDGQTRYTAGAEIAFDEQPIDVLEKLAKVANAKIAECGGIYKMRVGGASGSAVMSFDDDAIVVTDPQSFDPISSMSEIVTGVTANYISPDDGWYPKASPPRYDTALEAELGRRVVADISYDYAYNYQQVQRLMKASLLEEKRQRKHIIVLGPEAMVLEPNDIVQWSSVRNGYVNKEFEIDWLEVGPNCLCRIGMTEVDPDDYDWEAADELEEEYFPQLTYDIPSQAVQGFSVSGVTVPGDGGRDRPAIRATWDTDDIDDVRALSFEVRLDSGNVFVKADQSPDNDFDKGEYHIVGLSSDTDYEVRARYIPYSIREVDWTSWQSVSTPEVKLTKTEIAELEKDNLETDAVTRRYRDTYAGPYQPGDGYSSGDIDITVPFEGNGDMEIVVTFYYYIPANVIEPEIQVIRTKGGTTTAIGQWAPEPGLGITYNWVRRGRISQIFSDAPSTSGDTRYRLDIGGGTAASLSDITMTIKEFRQGVD